MISLRNYSGPVPPCGIYCGSCPSYTKDSSPCSGAFSAERCASCYFQKCTTEKGIDHCYECKEYPCGQFKYFSKRWKRFGQDLAENQDQLQKSGSLGLQLHYVGKSQNFARVTNEEIESKNLPCAGCPNCNKMVDRH
ncbi:MAG: DUF3795 domain-containing protein [Saprospiraceae bacterium]|nr:DUF3795 domain-containing protein [Saprospiraceae bacterium]